MMKKRFLLLAFVLFISHLGKLFAQPLPVQGTWKGKLQINERRSFEVAIEALGANAPFAAYFHSIDQQSFNYPVRAWGNISDSLWMRVSNLGAELRLLFRGDSAMGFWMQGPAKFSLKLARFSGDLNKPARPQEPGFPLPYHSKDITVKAKDGVSLAGTITWPQSGARFPAVLLVPGSGPSDRDQTIFGHKHFLVLADMLTRQGFAVLRMDDRGAGESSGDFSSSSIRQFADDAVSALQFLTDQSMVDANRVGMIGHSLGAEIAGLAASEQPRLRMLVLLAGSSEPLCKNIISQTEKIYKDKGASEAAIKLNTEVLNTVFSVAREVDNDSLALQKLEAQLQPVNAKLQAIPASDLEKVELEYPVKAGSFKQMLKPAMRFDLFYDPLTTLRNLKLPVLAVYAKEDVQVLAYNAETMNAVLKEKGKDKASRVVQFSPANHLLQRCNTCTVEEYQQLSNTIDPTYFQEILNWMTQVLK